MILNRHKREQAMLRIIACTIISFGEIKDPEAFGKMIDNFRTWLTALEELKECVNLHTR